MVARVQALMAGLWAGLVLALGAMTAPRLFALLPRADAGRVAGDLFGLEARLSLAVGVVMILLERRRHGDGPGGGASAMGPRMLIALAVIFLTVMAEYVLRPMLDAARQNQGAASASFLWLMSMKFETTASTPGSCSRFVAVPSHQIHVPFLCLSRISKWTKPPGRLTSSALLAA